jgi:hypothetical protein
MPDYLKVIVVDFDNTICVFREDFACEELIAGAKEGLESLREAGYRITISSARNNVMYGGCGGEPHRLMYAFLKEHELAFDTIDTGGDGKPVGYRYIDDKGVGCPRTAQGAVDWPQVCRLILGEEGGTAPLP